MNNTISKALPTKGITRDDLLSFINFDLLVFEAQVRASLNNQFRLAIGGLTLGTGALTTAWTSDPMPTNSAWHLGLKITGIDKSATPNGAAFMAYSLITRATGNVTVVGTNTISTLVSAGAFAFAVVGSGTSIAVQVQDSGVVTQWFAHI